jgi:hypothetical protein
VEPTVASTWAALSGREIGDDLLEWPPDMFALADLVLERSQAYRFVFSPPEGEVWPPVRTESWPRAVEEAARQWRSWADECDGDLPGLLATEWSVLRERAGTTTLTDLGRSLEWRTCEALLTIHALADEACAGLGEPLSASDGIGCVYRARGRELLARTGSLARVPSHQFRVLPMLRIAPGGSSLRALARYACVVPPGVDVQWHKVPTRHPGVDRRVDYATLLLLPWPLRIRQTDFHALESIMPTHGDESYGFFEFAPSERLDLDLVDRLLVAARDEVDSVDAVVLPESAVDEDEVEELEVLLECHGVVMLITGVRQQSYLRGGRPSNWVHTGLSPSLEKGRPPARAASEEWLHVRQNKHHRWSLDASQLFQYNLGGALHPNVRWWEAIEVPRRSVEFLELGEETTLVSLVCEDLAQIDEVADIIRAVGPTVVTTLLLDGPQLTSRWSARYASVLADDPGSAVVTLSCFGMVDRCRPPGLEASRVIALWKDPTRGTAREISLEPGAQGVLVTGCGQRGYRRTADGRRRTHDASTWLDVAVSQVRPAAVGSGALRHGGSPKRMAPPLSVLDVTLLTSIAQSVAEALAYAPGHVEQVLANAAAGACWRRTFGLEEPSSDLSTAINELSRIVRDTKASGDVPDGDDVLLELSDRLELESGLDRLVRRVLRSALEQRMMRVIEHDS